MDSSGNETKCFYFKEVSPFNPYSLPISITVSGIHRAVLEDDLEAVKRLVEAKVSVNAKENSCEFTPLHLAVIKNSVKIVDYLLSRDDIEPDTRCCSGDTPLRIASGLGAYNSVKKLIEVGANVNLPDDDHFSPLHASTRYPEISRLLIRNGANVNAVDSSGVTPLHCAVRTKSTETIHMLLYHNADANVSDDEDMTPFMQAIVRDVPEAQVALLDYVVDFNEVNRGTRRTVLGLALYYEAPYVKEMIERGADVNYGDCSPWTEEEAEWQCAFFDSLFNMEEETVSVFKMVWERLRCYRRRKAINLCRVFDVLKPFYLGTIIQVIIESDNFELAVDSFTRNENFSLFVTEFVLHGLQVEQLVVFTYRLLEFGYRPSLEDVRTIFSEYGACELRKVLPYMDVDCRESSRPESNSFLRAIFDLDFDARVLAQGVDSGGFQLTNSEVVSYLGLFRDPCLVGVFRSMFVDDEDLSEILKGLSKVPSLVELARDQARKYIRERFKVTNMCGFYTTIDYLDIPSVYKDILTYNRKIY